MTTMALSVTPQDNLTRYLQEIQKFPMLAPEKEQELAHRWVGEQDLGAAHQLVTSHLRLVAKIAFKYKGYGLPMGEVISEGNVGLMQAVKKFDPSRGFRLATYAMWWIKASIQEYILRSWSLVKVGTTAAQKKLFFNLRKLKGKMQAYGDGDLSEKNVDRIAKDLDVSREEVISMNQRMAGHDHSLNAAVGDDAAAEWQDWLVDDRESQEDVVAEHQEMSQRRELLEDAMASLKDRERDIFYHRRLADPVKTLEELSEKYDISRERVRQIEVRSMEKVEEHVRLQASAQKLLPVN